MNYPTYIPAYQPQQRGEYYPQQGAQAFAPVNSAQPQPAGFACRPVTGREEAQAVQVDFFGPGTLMPDLAHGVVYLKRFNQQTGACDMFEFSIQHTKEEAPVQYATLDDLKALREELLAKPKKAVKKNDDSDE